MIAVKKFLLRFLLWCLVGLVIAISVDFMISSGLRKTDIRKFAVWNDIYKGGLHPDLVVIGNSMAWNGYNTFILDTVLSIDSYNLAIDGHQIDYQLLRYDTYRRFNAKPKVIVINVSFGGVFEITADSRYEREQFFPFVLDDTLMSVVAKTKGISFFDRRLPLFRYFGYRELVEDGIASCFGKKEFPDGGVYKGYRGDELVWKRGVLDQEGVRHLSISVKDVELLNGFVGDAVSEGTKVVIVKYPVYLPARQKYENIEETDSVFLSISECHHVPILNYTFSSICEDSTNYNDPTHLNKKGSEVFTMQLCQDLDSLNVLE